MANGDQVQGGQQTGGGQRTYSEEDVMALMNEAARRAATEVMNKREDNDDDTAISVINPKVVKQLKDTVAVFTALKELSSNPLQKTIEETVGGMAASVVQSAFAPRSPPPKQDVVDKLLNSQFAYGLGSGLGQRAPELVESMGRTFGTDKAGQMMDSIIGKYGSGQGGSGQSRQLSPVPSSPSGPSGPSSPPSGSEQKTDKQTEKELLLSLDPNNPEHVSAYAETQGGLPVDVARKMLMIHQDAFIEQLKRDGMNVDQISTQRGSHTQPSPPAQQTPVQQTTPVQQSQPSPTQPVSPASIRQDIPPTYPGNYPGNLAEQSSHQPIDNIDNIDNIEYAEYHDVAQPGQVHGSQPVQQPGSQPISPSGQDNQQVEMMKTFATDIGKVMGDMLNKIESLNNTVFTLQSEMNDIKKQGLKQSVPVHKEIPPRIPGIEYPPSTTEVPITPVSMLSHPVGDKESASFETPSLETFENQIERSKDFFEEDVIDISSFKQELEEEMKTSAQRTEQQIPSPVSIQPVVQPVMQSAMQPIPPAPVVQPAPPVVQIEKPVTPQIQQQSMINELDKIPIIPNDKISEKDDNKFVTPIKKVGIHKKAAYKNLKPSFKKNEEKENKGESNINREV